MFFSFLAIPDTDSDLVKSGIVTPIQSGASGDGLGWVDLDLGSSPAGGPLL